MGVNGVLPKILPWAGRKIKLEDFQDGIVCQKRNQKLLKPPSAIDNSHHHKHKKRRLQKERKLRIGLDVSGWIAKACHGYGTTLLDERHLSNYGRATLWEQSRKNGIQQPQEQQDNICLSSDGAVSSTADNLDNQQQQQDGIMRDVTMEQEFVSLCSTMVMKKIRTLQEKAGAEILVVLDGATPPIKQSENKSRQQRREQAAQERDAAEMQEQHEKKFKAAKKAGASWHENTHLQSAIISSLLSTFRTEKIPFLVAPYEADGQLAFLAQRGYFDLVVTEDSDLIGHGTGSILYKINEETGEGILLQRSDLGATPPNFSLLDFSDSMLACMFVIAGCDYCNSLKGIGIVTARNIVKKAFHVKESHESKPYAPEIATAQKKPALRRVLDLAYESAYEKNLNTEEKLQYEQKFLAALLMFRHPVVFDPIIGKNTYVGGNPIQQYDAELMDYEPYARLVSNSEKKVEILGNMFDPSLQVLLAEGWINPKTNQPYPNMTLPSGVSDTLKDLTGNSGESAGDNSNEKSENVDQEIERNENKRRESKDQCKPMAATQEDDEGPATQDVALTNMPDTQDVNIETKNTFDSDLESQVSAKTADDFDSKEKCREEKAELEARARCLSISSDISRIDTTHEIEDDPETQEIEDSSQRKEFILNRQDSAIVKDCTAQGVIVESASMEIFEGEQTESDERQDIAAQDKKESVDLESAKDKSKDTSIEPLKVSAIDKMVVKPTAGESQDAVEGDTEEKHAQGVIESSELPMKHKEIESMDVETADAITAALSGEDTENGGDGNSVEPQRQPSEDEQKVAAHADAAESTGKTDKKTEATDEPQGAVGDPSTQRDKTTSELSKKSDGIESNGIETAAASKSKHVPDQGETESPKSVNNDASSNPIEDEQIQVAVTGSDETTPEDNERSRGTSIQRVTTKPVESEPESTTTTTTTTDITADSREVIPGKEPTAPRARESAEQDKQDTSRESTGSAESTVYNATVTENGPETPELPSTPDVPMDPTTELPTKLVPPPQHEETMESGESLTGKQQKEIDFVHKIDEGGDPDKPAFESSASKEIQMAAEVRVANNKISNDGVLSTLELSKKSDCIESNGMETAAASKSKHVPDQGETESPKSVTNDASSNPIEEQAQVAVTRSDGTTPEDNERSRERPIQRVTTKPVESEPESTTTTTTDITADSREVIPGKEPTAPRARESAEQDKQDTSRESAESAESTVCNATVTENGPETPELPSTPDVPMDPTTELPTKLVPPPQHEETMESGELLTGKQQKEIDFVHKIDEGGDPNKPAFESSASKEIQMAAEVRVANNKISNDGVEEESKRIKIEMLELPSDIKGLPPPPSSNNSEEQKDQHDTDAAPIASVSNAAAAADAQPGHAESDMQISQNNEPEIIDLVDDSSDDEASGTFVRQLPMF